MRDQPFPYKDKIDLHIHTLASDGKNSSKHIVSQAQIHGLKSIAITDHDNLGGIEEAIIEGQALDIEVIPGIELSVQYKNFKDLHILSYYPFWKEGKLANILIEFQQSRQERGKEMIGRINQCLAKEKKKPLDYSDILIETRGSLGRMHLARKLMEYGYVKDINEAFGKYLNPYNVPKKKFTAQDALSTIKEVGGLSVLAHPRLITPDQTILEEIVRQFAIYGLDGIEAIYPGVTYSDLKFYQYLSQKYNLILTGGSDYHGDAMHGMLGEVEDYGQLNYSLIINLRKRFLAQKYLLISFKGWPTQHLSSVVKNIATIYGFQIASLPDLLTKPYNTEQELLGRLMPLFKNKLTIVLNHFPGQEEKWERIYPSLASQGIKTFIFCPQDYIQKDSTVTYLIPVPNYKFSAHYLMHLLALTYSMLPYPKSP
jgi:hypothetical protein